MKRLNLLLVSPRSYDDSCDQKLTAYRMFPYSVVYLASFLKKHDLCDVDYIDLVVEPLQHLYNRIETEHFDLVGFTSTAEARFSTMRMIRKVHALSPGSKIVTGGHFFSNTANDALLNVPELDFVVRGEGEITLSHLVKKLSANDKDLSNINGLSYRDFDGTVIHNPDRKLHIDLSDFRIEYNLIMKPGYDLLFPMKNWEDSEKLRAFPVMLGRGCNNHCVFCTHRFLKYRISTLEDVIKQIDWARNRLGTTCFMFTDPSFSERKDFVRDLCNYLIEHKYNIRWYCETRADVSPDLLRLMNQAGCISVDFAMESGSEKVLKTLRKHVNLENIEAFARTCHDCGIRANFFTMVSLPGEREEDFRQTYAMIEKLLSYDMRTSLAPLVIYPGTPLESMAIERGILPRAFSWYDDSYECTLSFATPRERNMPHWIEHFSEAEVTSFLKKVNTLYYPPSGDVHTKTLLKTLKRGVIRSQATITTFLLRRYLRYSMLRLWRKHGRLGVFPGGKHTQFLLSTISDTIPSTDLVVFDDATNNSPAISGFPRQAPDQTAIHDLSCVILSTDCEAPKLRSRAHSLFSNKLVDLYRIFPYGPYCTKQIRSVDQELRYVYDPPYSPDIYRNCLHALSQFPNVSFPAFTAQNNQDSSLTCVFVRHDIDTADCLQRLHILTNLDLAFGVRAGIYFRCDNEEYLLSDYRQHITACHEMGFEIGVHTTCYLHDDYVSAFRHETNLFAETLGFKPHSFTVHGMGAFRHDIRTLFNREISANPSAYGYEFTDAHTNFRTYDHAIEDCHRKADDNSIHMCDDFTAPSQFVQGRRNCLILTHPCYWDCS